MRGVPEPQALPHSLLRAGSCRPGGGPSSDAIGFGNIIYVFIAKGSALCHLIVLFTGLVVWSFGPRALNFTGLIGLGFQRMILGKSSGISGELAPAIPSKSLGGEGVSKKNRRG